MSIDVTDATFEAEVINRSADVAVVVDLWAPWCGPCRQLGPLLEQAVDETGGSVVLVKVNIDENPSVAAAFRVQSIPAVYAMRDRKVVDSFIGAQGAPAVKAFVTSLLPSPEENRLAALLASGDEDSLRRALDLQPDHPVAVLSLAELLVADGRGDEALTVLARLPETAEVRRIAAMARVGADEPSDGMEAKLDDLLARAKGDEAARQEILDLFEVMGPDDPRTQRYRKALTAQLF